MNLISRPRLTILLLGGMLLGAPLCLAPAMAAEPMVVAFKLQPVQAGGQLAQNSRRDRRDRGDRRRIQRRNKDWIPLRSAPSQREFRDNDAGQQFLRQRRKQDQDAARDAVRRGEVLALDSIIRSVRDYCPGTFLDASLQRQGNGIFYRVKILRPSGKRVVLGVDARTGAVVGGRCR